MAQTGIDLRLISPQARGTPLGYDFFFFFFYYYYFFIYVFIITSIISIFIVVIVIIVVVAVVNVVAIMFTLNYIFKQKVCTKNANTSYLHTTMEKILYLTTSTYGASTVY